MATFLDIVQSLRQNAGIAGTGPSTVVGQTGEMKRLVDWTAAAWFEIQATHPDWRFKRYSVSFVTVAAQAAYTPTQAGATASTFSRWVKDSFRVYTTASGFGSEVALAFIPYEQWRDVYQFGAMRTTYSMPIELTVTPNNSLGFGPVTSAGFTINGDYYTAPIRMALDADVPELPAAHDPLLIVYKAMMYYGAFESAPEVFQFAKTQYDILFSTLANDQLPEIGLAGALA